MQDFHSIYDAQRVALMRNKAARQKTPSYNEDGTTMSLYLPISLEVKILNKATKHRISAASLIVKVMEAYLKKFDSEQND